MAEGAIEGVAAMYEVATTHSTAFAFSRFDAAQASSREEEGPPLLLETHPPRRPRRTQPPRLGRHRASSPNPRRARRPCRRELSRLPQPHSL